MYDADRPAVEAWWRAIAEACRSEGIDDVPGDAAWPDDLDDHWHDDSLLLSQTCGRPLVTRLRGLVQVVGVFRYDVPGCSGIDYRSELLVRADDTARELAGFAGRVAAINDPGSQSGCHALKAMVGDAGFFGRWIETGSHRASIEAVRSRHADIAAIDCVTLAGLRRQRPDVMDGLRVLGSTPPTPGLPLITSRSTPPGALAALRRALRAACADARWTSIRERLFIAAFEPADASAWPSA